MFTRPGNPSFLRQATFRLFGEACLRCSMGKPLDMAHILDWRDCVAFAGRGIRGLQPPPEWHYQVAVDSFHNIRNVVPLCCNCHRLLDHKKFPEVTRCEILELRNQAVMRPEVLAHMVDFVGAELSGRPNRCRHKTEAGKREHTHMTDPAAAVMPLPWIAAAYRAGTLTDNPNMIVEGVEGWHYHVRLDHGSISFCSGVLAECAVGARVWTRKQTRPRPSSPRSTSGDANAAPLRPRSSS